MANNLEIRGGIDWACRRGEDSFLLQATVNMPEERIDFVYSVEVQIVEKKCQIKKETLRRKKYRPNAEKYPYEIRLFWTDDCESGAPSIIARLYNEKRGTPRPFARTHSVLSQLLIQAEADVGLRKEITQGVEIFSK